MACSESDTISSLSIAVLIISVSGFRKGIWGITLFPAESAAKRVLLGCCRSHFCAHVICIIHLHSAPIKVSEFRKGVWGITLFSPEKGFPQKDCPGKANFHAHLQKTGKKRQLPFMEAAGKAVMLFSFNHLFYSDGEALHLCVGLHVKSNYSYKVSACL